MGHNPVFEAWLDAANCDVTVSQLNSHQISTNTWHAIWFMLVKMVSICPHTLTESSFDVLVAWLEKMRLDWRGLHNFAFFLLHFCGHSYPSRDESTFKVMQYGWSGGKSFQTPLSTCSITKINQTLFPTSLVGSHDYSSLFPPLCCTQAACFLWMMNYVNGEWVERAIHSLLSCPPP